MGMTCVQRPATIYMLPSNRANASADERASVDEGDACSCACSARGGVYASICQRCYRRHTMERVHRVLRTWGVLA
jgi:hypothetical protein